MKKPLPTSIYATITTKTTPPTNPTLNHSTMPSDAFYPVQYQPATQPAPHRTRTTCYYTHMVQESLTSRVGKFICSMFLSLLFVACLIFFILWLKLRPHRPRFYLNSFVLNQPGSPISFSVSDSNPNENIGIYYSDINSSVYYFDQVIASGPVMSAFYQPPKHATPIEGLLAEAANTPVPSQITSNQSTSQVQLRLELESTIRFKLSTWDTHNHRMHVSCYFTVGADGNLLPQFVNERCPIYF